MHICTCVNKYICAYVWLDASMHVCAHSVCLSVCLSVSMYLCV